MATSLETLSFAKQSVKQARLTSEKLIAEMAPNIAKLKTPVELRIIELRGFVQGVLSGQETVLNHVRDLVPPAALPTLVAVAQKVAAPETHWSDKFHASLDPIMVGEQKSQERAEAFLAKLAKRVRDLAVWEGVLEQLIAKASSPATTKKTTPVKGVAKPAKSNSDFELDVAKPGEKIPDGSTGDLTDEIQGNEDGEPSDSNDDFLRDLDLGDLEESDDTPSGDDLQIDLTSPKKK